MATQFKTLKEYLYPDNGHKIFIIPNYQRGYKWSVKTGDEDSSVEYLLKSLKVASYSSKNEQQFFLQGVTVVEDGDNVVLIDGQQRTTTLYLLLWCLGRENISGNRNIDLDYTIRKQSRDYLNKLKLENFDYEGEDPDNLNQDIFYFKQAISQINKGIIDIDKESFARFILNKVSLLYIVVDREKAVRTFTMMNGQKAKMHDEELVKAEMLHIVSQLSEPVDLPNVSRLEDTFFLLKEIASKEWETNALRSKYAREWDKWLYWWNREDVKSFFNTQNPMGLLLEYYYTQQKKENNFSFRNFKEFLPDGNVKQTKDVFKALRDLQKDFEDVFNNPISFNYLKCAMIGSGNENEDKYNIIMYFIENKRNRANMEYYAKWRLIGSTHIEITEPYTNDPTVEGGRIDNAQRRKERSCRMIRKLSETKVYGVYNDLLNKQLLRLNVEEYNQLNGGAGVKFDFSIWANKSLEHILPKSHFYHIETTEDGQSKYVRGDGMEIAEDETYKLMNTSEVFSDPEKFSEHCIGNLVLLYGNNNSGFGNLSFAEKKEKFFNNERSFESRNLLHTISSFASSTWTPKDIEVSAQKTIRLLAKNYNVEGYE